MSFSFSFSGDDIEQEESDHETQTPSTKLSSRSQNAKDEANSLVQGLRDTSLDKATPQPKPKYHTFSDLLTSLPSQISYNYIDIPIQSRGSKGTSQHKEQKSSSTDCDNSYPDSGNNSTSKYTTASPSHLQVPRRSLFDIRQQLMAESDPEETNDQTGGLLAGLETGDLSTGIYEGGFKTWECAVDLAGYVHESLDKDDQGHGDRGWESESWHIIEMGAGSAIPSLVLLVRLVEGRRKRAQDGKRGGGTATWGRVRFTLCDYNEDVLRLGTAVNVFLVLALDLRRERATNETSIEDGITDEDEEDLEVDDELIQEVLAILQEVNVEVGFISGAWGEDFVKLVSQEEGSCVEQQDNTRTLLLASETIYSPSSLRVFSQTALDILRATKQDRAQALIAAKKVYFGVGGGIQEFEDEIRQLGGGTKLVHDVKSAGVGRVVLEVSSNR